MYATALECHERDGQAGVVHANVEESASQTALILQGRSCDAGGAVADVWFV